MPDPTPYPPLSQAIFLIAEYDQFGIGRCISFLDGIEISQGEYWAVQDAAIHRALNGEADNA